MIQERRLLKRAERLFALAMYLKGSRTATAAVLAEHFGVSERTIYRDLQALSKIGVPLIHGDKTGYAILKGYRLPPLILTAHQAAAVLMGTEFIKLRSDKAMIQEAEEVAEKIRTILPQSIREYIDKLNEGTALDPYWLHKAPVHGYWSILSEAIAKRRVVWMEYFVRSRKERTERQVDPLGLVFYTDHWNLIAYDHLRREIRQFALAHIQDLSMLSRRFTPPEGFELKQYLKERSAAPAGERIEICFAASVYDEARSSIPAMLEQEWADDGSVTVVFRFDNMAYLAQLVLRYGLHARVVAPVHLRKRVRALALRVAAQYETDEGE